MSAALEAARAYVARGWNPLPLPFKSKIPTDKGWQHRVIGAADLPRYFNGRPQNVGVVLGPSSAGLTDLDLDCREAIAIAPYILPKTGAIFGRHSAPASHWLYYSSLSSRLDKATIQFRDPMKPRDEAMLLEVRVGGEKGAQTVFPGSVHETDEEIRWDEAREPPVVFDHELLKQAHMLACACLFARYWPGKGARHDVGLVLGGFLARAGLDQPQIKCMVEGAARAAGDEEWKDRVRAAEDAARAFHEGKRTAGFPLVSKTFGEQVAQQVAEWLKYTGSTAPDAEDEFSAEPIDPVDLWAKFDPPTLPRGLLPQVIEDFAFDRGMTMGCDVAGIAVGALVVCGAAIHDDIKLQPKQNDADWQESARLWAFLVGDVSAMKTPALKGVVRPLSRISTEMARDNAEAMGRWCRLPPPVRKVTPPPPQPQVMTMNATPEAVQQILKDSPWGILLFRDELAGFFGSLDQYSGSKGAASADRPFWLESYGGGPYSVDRVSRPNAYIPNLSVSILGGIQPGKIRALDNASEDDGLIQRGIPIVMRAAVLGRDEVPSQATNDYEHLIRRLRELRPPRSGFLYPPDAVLKFDDGALKIREELEQEHLELSQCSSLNRKLASHIGKYNGIFARLCVVWHCIDHADDAELPVIVTEDTARRVRDFLHGFLLPHAIAFYAGTLGLANDHDVMADIAGYILARKLDEITSRNVQQGTRDMRRLIQRETNELFEQLEAFGWLTRKPGARPSSLPRWVVNPVVHQRYAERAKAEKERRERERQIIVKRAKGGSW